MSKKVAKPKSWEWVNTRIDGKLHQQYRDAVEKLAEELQRKVYGTEIIVPTIQAFVEAVNSGKGRQFLVEGRKPGKQSGK